MNKALFYVVRHGRTEGNENNIYRGWSNAKFAQLSSDGREDIKAAAEFLKKIGVSAPIILSDDLDRAVESQQILADNLGIKELATDKRLRPLNVGDFTGKEQEDHPLDSYTKYMNKPIPGGESLNEFNKRLAKVFQDILELVAQLKEPVLIIGHGSTLSFLNYVGNNAEMGYEGLVYPGGVAVYTKNGITPLFSKKLPDTEASKLDQAIVLYMDGSEIGRPEGARCADCKMFITGGKCGVKAGPTSGPKGVCGLYAFGKPDQMTEEGTLSDEAVGYVELGATHCKSCEYFGGPNRCQKVKSEPKKIEAEGCCNAWDEE